MTLIDVREHGRVAVSEELVAAVPFEFWRSTDCQVARGPSDTTWTLTAGSSVGIARTRTPSGEVTLQVRPKLDSADVFFLSDYAYGQRHESLRLLAYDDVDLEAVLRDPTACLLVWHATTIRRFAARWLRRDYQTRTQVLDGKVKGKILISRYVGGHLAVGDAARIPCKVQERTQDTPNNRLLKAGLRYVASISYNLPVPAARNAVLREVNATLPLFAQVSDIRVSPKDVRATSTKGPQRHYAAVLQATIGLLQNRLMGDEVGRDLATSAFMWRMPILFQEALRGILDSVPGLVLESRMTGTARIYDAAGVRRQSSKVDPDLVLRLGDGRTLLIDTKYKDALPAGQKPPQASAEITAVTDRHRIRISRSDIYQAVAYSRHERWPDARAALLYPLVLAPQEDVPAPMQLRGFGDPVSLMFVDIGRHARTNLPAFIAHLRGAAGVEDASRE